MKIILQKKWYTLYALVSISIALHGMDYYNLDIEKKDSEEPTEYDRLYDALKDDDINNVYAYRCIKHGIAAFSIHHEFLDKAITTRWHQLADQAYAQLVYPLEDEYAFHDRRDLPPDIKIALYTKAYCEILAKAKKFNDLLHDYLKIKHEVGGIHLSIMNLYERNHIQRQKKNEHWFEQFEKQFKEIVLGSLTTGNKPLFIFYIKQCLNDWFLARLMRYDWILSDAKEFAQSHSDMHLLNGIKYTKEKAGHSKDRSNKQEYNFSMLLYMYEKNMKEHEDKNAQMLYAYLNDQDIVNSLNLSVLRDAKDICEKKGNKNLSNKIQSILDKKEKWEW